MQNDVLSSVNPRKGTPQSEAARPDQVENSAGGFVFAVDDWGRALRFLILGTDSPTYYVSAKDLTKENAAVIIRLAADQGDKLVELIVEVSENGRAPKQNPTIFALAACMASPDVATRRLAASAVSRVCRTGTHLFIFARYVEQFRGWGRIVTGAIGAWYTEKPLDDLGYQVVKYRQRENRTHRDLLRQSHPRTGDSDRRAIFDWITHGVDRDVLPRVIRGYEAAKLATTPRQWAALVIECNLPWEALPDAALPSPDVWAALYPRMGLTALIRQLGRLTKLGLISGFGGEHTVRIANRIRSQEHLTKSRVHPLAILVAQATYASGHGYRGKETWTPAPAIIDALNEAFYLAFGNIQPAGKRTLLACDVSPSMEQGTVANTPLTPHQAVGAMAMVAMKTEPEVMATAFAGGFTPLGLSAGQRLDDVQRAMLDAGWNGERTDCAVPILWATQNKIPVETFIVYTDNETWSGSIHPFEALRKFREQMGINARLIVVGMTSTGFSIADPSDPGMMDVVGFDTAAPDVMSSFSRGDL